LGGKENSNIHISHKRKYGENIVTIWGDGGRKGEEEGREKSVVSRRLLRKEKEKRERDKRSLLKVKSLGKGKNHRKKERQ